MFNFFKKRKKTPPAFNPEAEIVVTYDAEAITVKRPNGQTESVRWLELGAVIIETTDEGPFTTDVFWIRMGREAKSGCIVPAGATGENELLRELQRRLPDVDNENLINAMGSTDNQKFLIWQEAS